MKKLVLLVTFLVSLVFSVGCMGTLNSLTGLDLEVQLGESATHPADFPAGEVSGGERVMSMGMTATADSLDLPEGVSLEVPAEQKYRMEMVTYVVDPADVSDRFNDAKAESQKAGFSLIEDDTDFSTLRKGDTLFLIIHGKDGDEGNVSFMRLAPVSDATPAPEK